MKTGIPVIINEFDRPCARLVAIVTGTKEGIVMAKYLAKDTNSTECAAPADKVTPLEVFGMRLDIDNGVGLAWVNECGANRATYSDGAPRKWQEELHHVGGIKIRPEVAKLVGV